MNVNCTYCVCTDPIRVNTTVVTTNGAPISGVELTLGGRPDVKLGESGVTGVLYIDDLCLDGNVTFSKDGFVTTTLALQNLQPVLYLAWLGKYIYLNMYFRKILILGN